jgi:hypothetical protein
VLREPPTNERTNPVESIECDLAIVGGGMAGVCCAITAAREGLRVTLVNDRPVLGGNASSEVRLWVLGATSHMGNNNRWAREGGVIDEILIDNTYRNPEGNPILFDAILLEKVREEPNIDLLLNTAIFEVRKSSPDRIAAVRGFCSQNSTAVDIAAPLFVDASGDGIVGFLAGAAFRMGAESTEEFGEKFAPSGDYGELLGHSLYFYTKDVGRPIEFTPPSFALRDITEIPRYRMFNSNDQGCQLWWIEYGGRLDTIRDAEKIKWELWRVVYGVWDHIKNSGLFPEAETLTLEWVGQISGKRESRRFEGDYLLTQQDLVEQRRYADAVSYGGWAIDLHPADGVFSELPACNQWHSKGVYQIPYRSMYSRNIENLFLAGRLISASHVAFGSTRVMGTCAHNAQATAMAAKVCSERQWLPKQLAAPENVGELQSRLQRSGQFIPHVVRHDALDLAQRASLTASSSLILDELPMCEHSLPLTDAWAMLVPVKRGRVPEFTFFAAAETATELHCELRGSSREGNFTPDVTLAERVIAVSATKEQPIATPHSSPQVWGGARAVVRLRRRVVAHSQTGSHRPLLDDGNGHGDIPLGMHGPVELVLDFDVAVERDQYVLVCLQPADVDLYCSDQLVTGILAVRHGTDARVALRNKQQPPTNIGIEAFELWCPRRRPQGRNLAMRISPGLDCFRPENVLNGIARPTTAPNAWVAAWDDPRPRLTLSWPEPQTIRRVELTFDTDRDHPMETVLMGHPERVMPYCVRQFRVLDGAGRELARCDDNYQTRRVITFDAPVITSTILVELTAPAENIPAALMEVRCYAE